jgi:hypothetical protein
MVAPNDGFAFVVFFFPLSFLLYKIISFTATIDVFFAKPNLVKLTLLCWFLEFPIS